MAGGSARAAALCFPARDVRRADRRDARARHLRRRRRAHPAAGHRRARPLGRARPAAGCGLGRADRRHPGGAGGRHAGERRDAAQLRRRRVPVAAVRDGAAARRGARGLGARHAGRDRSEVERARDVGGDPPRRRPGHRFLPARRARPAARRERRHRQRAARAGGLPQRARAHAVDLGRRDARLPAAGLSGRVLHRAAAAVARAAAAVPRAAAVLDVAAGAHGRLGRAAAARRHPEQPVPVARPRHRAACG